MKQKHNQFPVLPLIFLLLVATMTFLLLVATMTGILSDIYLVKFISEEHIGITIGILLVLRIIWKAVKRIIQIFPENYPVILIGIGASVLFFLAMFVLIIQYKYYATVTIGFIIYSCVVYIITKISGYNNQEK
jgi:cytochrome b561